MLAVERHFIEGNSEIVRLCALSKELYNKCNFLMRQAWFAKATLPNINNLVEYCKYLDCFQNLHNTKTAKQTIRKVLTDWSNFHKALNAYNKDSSKFLNRPKPPYYKNKLAQVIFYNETIRRGQKYLDKIVPTNDCFEVKSTIKNFKQVVITPKTFGFIVDVQYDVDKDKLPKTSKEKIASIDLGLNNLCAITSDQHSPLLVNGRILKSVNQWFNKHKTKTKSRKRYFRIENYFHHISKYIVANCVKYGIGKIIIGKNDGWKQNINLGKKNNQHFSSMPFYRLIEKIQYKADQKGIEVLFTEESYTSKASFLDRDVMPIYNKEAPKPIFSGKRIKRGLYQSANGTLLNADVNGSANIGRKVIKNEEYLLRLDRSLAARPVVVNPLKVLSV